MAAAARQRQQQDPSSHPFTLMPPGVLTEHLIPKLPPSTAAALSSTSHHHRSITCSAVTKLTFKGELVAAAQYAAAHVDRFDNTFNQVQKLYLTACNLSDSQHGLGSLLMWLGSKLPQLKAVSIDTIGLALDDDPCVAGHSFALTSLSACVKGLVSLTFTTNDLCAAEAVAVGSMTGLTSLALECEVEAQHLAYLSSLKQLQHLTIGDFNDDGELVGTSSEDQQQCFDVFNQLRDLQSLNLYCEVNVPFGYLPSGLTHLFLWGARGNVDVAALADRLPLLKKVHLERGKCGSVQQLSRLTALTELRLQDCKVGGTRVLPVSELFGLSSCTQLEVLEASIAQQQQQQSAGPTSRQLISVRSLILNDDGHLPTALQLCPFLTSLQAGLARVVGPAAVQSSLQAIGGYKTLKHLKFHSRDAALDILAHALGQLPGLTHLRVSTSAPLDIEGLTNLVQALNGLRELQIIVSGSRGWSVAKLPVPLPALLMGMQQLRRLGLQRVHGLTRDAVLLLMAAVLPRLEVLQLARCRLGRVSAEELEVAGWKLPRPVEIRVMEKELRGWLDY